MCHSRYPDPMWTPEIVLSDGEIPLATRLARAITADIRRGRLPAGERLPGSRTLAARLGLHRNTVLAAYRDLVAEGWLVGEPGRGTRVGEGLVEEPARARARQAGFPVAPARHAEFHEPVTAPINLAEGHPDLVAFPAAALGRAWRAAVLRQPKLLGYGDARGHLRLREVVAEMLAATRGMAVQADDVLITHGAQQALDLTARALCRPGDVVAVEALGYPPAWAAFRAAGATLDGMELDEESVKAQEMIGQVSTLVRENPDAAATLVKRWLNR